MTMWRSSSVCSSLDGLWTTRISPIVHQGSQVQGRRVKGLASNHWAKGTHTNSLEQVQEGPVQRTCRRALLNVHPVVNS